MRSEKTTGEVSRESCKNKSFIAHIPPLLAFSVIFFCTRRPGEETDTDSFVLNDILLKKHSDFLAEFPIPDPFYAQWRNEVSYQEDDGHRVLKRMVDCVG